MLQKKVWFVFMVSLFVASLAGCGNGASTTAAGSGAGSSHTRIDFTDTGGSNLAIDTSTQFTATGIYAEQHDKRSDKDRRLELV